MKIILTGAAGFIGSHILKDLLSMGYGVVGIDNLSTGSTENLDQVRTEVGPTAYSRFIFLPVDMCHTKTIKQIFHDVNSSNDPVFAVCHQAAHGSVPRSIKNPIATYENNVMGFMSILEATKSAGIKRVVYASSSSVYGDDLDPERNELRPLGNPLSPYAASKQACEALANVYFNNYGLETIGLRYFNVFGRRQNQTGPYAPVIAKWLKCAASGNPLVCFGNGEQKRDFTPVSNAVYANHLAMSTNQSKCFGKSFNVGLGKETSLNELANMAFDACKTKKNEQIIQYRDERPGDVGRSFANMKLSKELLDYSPIKDIDDAMIEMTQYLIN